jgi:cytochrome P450
MDLNGQRLKCGDLSIGAIAAASHDPARFREPATLDLDRPTARHLAFGHGAHDGLGAPLARLEGEIALNTLVRRPPGLRLAVPEAELRWRLVPMFRGLTVMPVAWG